MTYTKSNIEFLLENLAEELKAGRTGKSPTFDDRDLLSAYDAVMFDLYGTSFAREGDQSVYHWLQARRAALRAEILLRMQTGR